jgi:hypothetical protein
MRAGRLLKVAAALTLSALMISLSRAVERLGKAVEQ